MVGRVLAGQAEGYAEARSGFDLGVRQRPALAVLAATQDDIVVPVRLARDHGLGIGAQATCHGPTVPTIVSGGGLDGMVRVWRPADGTPVMPPLDLPEPGTSVAVHGNVIVTAAGYDIAVHQPARPRPIR